MGTSGMDVISALVGGDADGALERLAPGAVLHSPAADYDDPARIAAVVRALAGVVRDGRVARVLASGDEVVAFFTASVAGRPADGMLRVVAPDGGRATDVTLMVRPLGALLAGVEQMKARLAA